MGGISCLKAAEKNITWGLDFWVIEEFEVNEYQNTPC